MESQEILIAHPQTSDQVSALKAFMQALKIKLEVANGENYNLEFVEKIWESKRQITQVKFTEIKPENIESLIDSL